MSKRDKWEMSCDELSNFGQKRIKNNKVYLFMFVLYNDLLQVYKQFFVL